MYDLYIADIHMQTRGYLLVADGTGPSLLYSERRKKL